MFQKDLLSKIVKFKSARRLSIHNTTKDIPLKLELDLLGTRMTEIPLAAFK
jgi:hypothetical protein